MYGLHHNQHHFNVFDKVKSLPKLLHQHGIRTGVIGKLHVGPPAVFPFDFTHTEETDSEMQVGRNITRIRILVEEFLNANDSRPFFLYVAFHDPHRCGHTNPEFGAFCELFGNGEPGMGRIADWQPNYFNPENVTVPYFVPDTEVARKEIAAQYTAVDRMDQGIRLILEALRHRNLLESTLIIYSSDNGIPFPSGRTNLYDPGMREPLIISHPSYSWRWGQRSTKAVVSLLDITPTILAYFDIKIPEYRIFSKTQKPVRLTGKSLLPLLQSERNRKSFKQVFCSHSLHEITMYYPMRMLRTFRYKLIHNMNFEAPFPIDQDFYISETFQDLLNKSRERLPTKWYKNITEYYFRSEWELFDLHKDPQELKSIAKEKPELFEKLKRKLLAWQNRTDDPWLCNPHGVLEDSGAFLHKPKCMPLYNFD